MTPLTLAHLCRYTLARSLFRPTTLARAVNRLGFVQADPIRAPARAQDLTLRHRVVDYRAGDLVRYKGVTYKVRELHTSLPGWQPTLVPALFGKV